MLLVIIAIAIAFICLGVLALERCSWNYEGLFTVLTGIGVAVGIISLIITAVGFSYAVQSSAIDRKIEIYKEENTAIEERITATVEAYIEHESGVHGELTERIKGGDALTLIATYPELRSSEIVAKQIEVYEENNKELKELYSAKADAQVWKWWVYFGG